MKSKFAILCFVMLSAQLFSQPARIASYDAYFCRVPDRPDNVVLRRVEYSGGGVKFLVLNTVTFRTWFESFAELPRSADIDALDDGSAYFALRREMLSDPARFVRGVDSTQSGGYMLTADLCPTKKPLRRDFVDYALSEGITPLYLCVSGKWMAAHDEDLEWLREKNDIVWVNHSYDHYYNPAAPDSLNFLLRPGADLAREILENERLMVEKGLLPSVFYRYPGLVSDARVLRAVLSYGLVPLGSNAWLFYGGRPAPGSIILVHANGNEAEGLDLFFDWHRTTPLLPSGFIFR